MMEDKNVPGREGVNDARSKHFIEEAIEEDLKAGRFDRVQTRFPPEPNGYLHIGHAKAIAIDFGMAAKYGGRCNLRFDDTNPAREDTEYVEAIKEDIRWLGYDSADRCYYASDYFEQLYRWAEQLVAAGKAYVCDLTADEIRRHRGTLTEPGRNSPHRDRGVEENLDLFRRMRAGEFPDGSRTLRAKIDMAAPNINLRDPVMYRILRARHHRTGDAWCIYPSYDWAHGQSDSLERVTHSLCSLEFEDHRPLYEWFIRELGIFPSRQIEFARLNLTHTVMSKRRLRELVEGGHVSGWDDPRMPTLGGLRRRGYTPEAVREFLERAGVAKTDSVVDFALLEHCLREDLNRRAQRVMVVLRPLRVVIENYPAGRVEEFEAVNNPEDPAAGSRRVAFSRELLIETDDFCEAPPPKYFRLAPGREVRLKHAYFIRCERVVKDGSGRVIELRCSYDPDTRGGEAPDGRRVKGTLHWVSAPHSVPVEVRLYDHLFAAPDPDAAGTGEDWKSKVNPGSLEVLADCRAEAGLAAAPAGSHYQFLRHGYFCADPATAAGRPVFNRTTALRDSWARMEKDRAAGRREER
jgi:glutaminyl-tRNA synthetase